MKRTKLIRAFSIATAATILLFYSCIVAGDKDYGLKYARSVLKKISMTQDSDSTYVDDDCMYLALRVLEKISNRKPRTKFSHWGEHYDGVEDAVRDSIMFDSILSHIPPLVLDSILLNSSDEINDLYNMDCIESRYIRD